ncbi:MAG: hypothetical protein WBH55_12585, partial [Bacteroidota bacterium]
PTVRAIPALLALTAILLAGCGGKEGPAIHAGIDECGQCKMVISQTNQAAGYMYGGDFHPFCAPTCLLKAYGEKRRVTGTRKFQLYFADFETGNLLPADSVYFLMTDRLPTVMNSGVLCFSSMEMADARRQLGEESITDWRGFLVARSIPDRTINVVVAKGKLSPEVIVAEKGDIVELKIASEDTEREYIISIKGYEEAGYLMLAKGEGVTSFRLMTDKPGAGFPIINVKDNATMGMIKVHGAHTADEAVS